MTTKTTRKKPAAKKLKPTTLVSVAPGEDATPATNWLWIIIVVGALGVGAWFAYPYITGEMSGTFVNDELLKP